MLHSSRCSSVLVALLMLLGLPALLPAQNGFIRSIPLNPFNADVQPIPATGGYLLASRFYDSIVPTMVFMELDAFGRTLAVHGHPSIPELEIISLEPLAGGNYVGVGVGTDAVGDGALSLLVNAQGQVSQPRQLTYNGYFYWYEAVAMPDSGFVAIGQGSIVLDDDYATIARFDRNGDTLWTRMISRTGESFEFSGVNLLPGGDLMAVGNLFDPVSNKSEVILVRLSPNGGIRWAKRWSTSNGLYAVDLKRVGTKLFTALNTEDATGNVYNMGMAAMDTAGNVAWATNLGGYADAGTAHLSLSANGQPLLLGYHETSVGYNASMAALDASTGNLLWARGYDLNGEADLFQALPLSGGRYFLLAEEYSSADPIHIIETMQDGMIPGPCASLTPAFQPAPLTITTLPLTVSVRAGMSVTVPVLGTSSPVVDNILNCEPVAVDPARAQVPVQVLPHPMQTSARAVLPADFDRAGALIQVTDLHGRAVDMLATRTDDGFELHRNGLAAGLYAYQILQGGRRVAAGKLVLQDGF
jgi:hypothetical protein